MSRQATLDTIGRARHERSEQDLDREIALINAAVTLDASSDAAWTLQEAIAVAALPERKLARRSEQTSIVVAFIQSLHDLNFISPADDHTGWRLTSRGHSYCTQFLDATALFAPA